MGSMNAIPQTFEFWARSAKCLMWKPEGQCFLAEHVISLIAIQHFSIGAIDEGNSVFSKFFWHCTKISRVTLVIVPAHVEHSCNPMPIRHGVTRCFI